MSQSPSNDGAQPLLERLFTRLAGAQYRRPGWLLLAAAVSLAVAGWLASNLSLKTAFGELLPENAQSVKVAERVSERLVSASTLTIVAQGEDPEALKRFVDALSPRLRELGPDWVGNVDDGVRASQEFFKKNALLYAPLDDVREVHGEIVTRYDYEVRKAAGLDFGVDEPPPPLTADTLRQRVQERSKERAKSAGLPPQVAAEGYYIEPDGKMIAIIAQTPLSISDQPRIDELTGKVRAIVDEIVPELDDPTLEVHFTGDLITGAAQYQQIKNDLANVGILGVAMILGVVFLFYLRIRTVLAMMISVGVGVTWTFGLAYVAIGHLNSSTGFLVSIVAGNGINFGIIFMARYLEARRSQGVEESLITTHRATVRPTLAASAAAMVAYGSLVVTDFRGFKHFGIIGGAGMLLCWLATYLFLGAVLAQSERLWPIDAKTTSSAARLRGLYGRPFAYVVERFPRAILAIGVVLGLAGTGLAVWYVANDPMEYNLKNTRNERDDDDSSAQTLMRRVDKVVGRRGQDGLAILVDRVDQVEPLKAALLQRRDRAPADRKPFSQVVTINSLLPTDQPEKIALAAEAQDRLEKAHKRGFISDEDWNALQEYLPNEALRPIGADDLPEQVARSFIEKDGTRGRLVYIVPTPKRSIWDAHYLLEWAESFEETTLPDGSVIRGSGKSVIFADLFRAVVRDAPRAIIASLVGTILIVLVAFRGRRIAWGALATLLLGVVWMVATLAVFRTEFDPELKVQALKLNFLNFVALPISIGISADYVVNILGRYRQSGPGSIVMVVRETGGAVILCSLTTTLGYFALTFSVNQAIQSFGIAGAVGEISCVLATVLVLPAAIAWLDARRDRLRASRPAPAPPPA